MSSSGRAGRCAPYGLTSIEPQLVFAMILQIVLPLRNPSEVLAKTVQSLAEQTSRDFSVLISDNHSTKGTISIASAVRTLEQHGLNVRVVQPPEEIGRVEHWNWSHRQATADWIKPLFVGDWLETSYVAALHGAVASHPQAEIVNCSFASHHADGTRQDTVYPGGFRTPGQVLAEAFRVGNNFGGPVNVCFRRLAFECIGGYPPALPVSADFWVTLMIALRRGLVTLPEVLAHFHYHPARFSTNFPTSRIDGPREFEVILTAATSWACFQEIPHDATARERLLRGLQSPSWRQKLRRWLRSAFKSKV